MCGIPKRFEKLITDVLYYEISPFLSLHGFRKSRTSTTIILELTTIVNEGFSNKIQTDVIYILYNPSVRIINLVSHTTYVVCLNLYT